jgi:8-oxo-dGTP diphosphatase
LRRIAQALLFDRHGRLVIYLRDDKPKIPFPNHWDLIGGHVEPGETPDQALVREVEEEIGVKLSYWQFFRRYECLTGDAYPNVKFIYSAVLDTVPAELTLYEGQLLISIDADQRKNYRFANILAVILEDFFTSDNWPAAVDNCFGKIPAR